MQGADPSADKEGVGEENLSCSKLLPASELRARSSSASSFVRNDCFAEPLAVDNYISARTERSRAATETMLNL